MTKPALYFFCVAYALLSKPCFAIADVSVESANCTFSATADGADNIRLQFHQKVDDQYGTLVIPLSLIPLREGLSQAIRPTVSSDDTAQMSYANGILTYTSQLRSNYTNDSIRLAVSPDLKQIKSAHYLRTSRIPFGPKTEFECQF